MLTDFTDRLVKASLGVAASQAPDEYFEQISADLVAKGEGPLPPMTPERRKRLAKGDSFSVTPTQEHTIEMSLAAHAEMTSMFHAMAWKLIRFPEPCLFTSDHPVSYWREPSPADSLYGIGPVTAREVRIPLSPSAVLILTWPPSIDRVHDAEHEGDERIARCLNRDLLLWPASKQWLLHPGLAHPLPFTASRWNQEWPRPWMKSGRYGEHA